MSIRIATRLGAGRNLSAAGVCIALLAGCAEAPSRLDSRAPRSAETIRTIAAGELERTVKDSRRPVVVEFGVGAGCFRCNDMRPHYEQLAETFAEGVQFVRVDINAASAAASKYGATVCPSYVVFAHGDPVACCRYPTSADLLEREIEQALRAIPDADPTTSEPESLP